MKSFSIGLALLVVFLAGGCSSTRSLAVSRSSSVPTTYEQGTAVMHSQKRDGVVVRLLTPQFSKELNGLPSFFVAVSNGGDKALDFSTANVTAFCGTNTVKVYTFEKLEKQVKRDAALLAFATAMNSASQAMAASMPQQSYTAGSVNAYGSNGTYARANYMGTTTTYNPAAVAAAQAQINANSMNQMTMIASSRDVQLNGLGAMLRRNTVEPGSFAGGVVKLDPDDIEDGQVLKLLVTIADETHEFVFDVGE